MAARTSRHLMSDQTTTFGWFVARNRPPEEDLIDSFVRTNVCNNP
jgi:hypothetical protein